MTLNPALRGMVAAAKGKYEVQPLPAPNTYIDDLRFGALVEALKQMGEGDDEARDNAITDALITMGGIAPASYREFYE